MNTRVLRVAHVCPYRIVRDALRALLERGGDIEVVDEVEDADVLLLDLAVDRRSRLALIQRAQLGVLLLADEGGPDVHEAMAAGASGCVLQRASAEELVRALRTVAAGGRHWRVPVDQAERAAPRACVPSNRELQVLRLLALGAGSKEIAAGMLIAECTVKEYVRSLCRKLGAQNRAHAVRIGFERRWLGERLQCEPLSQRAVPTLPL